MSITPQVYAKARAEIVAVFGWNADSLSADQTLRIDVAVALRLAVDDLQGRVVRGETIDVTRMLTASEALSRLLPPAVLANAPEQRDDRGDHEATIAPLRKLYRHLHEQVHTLSAENAQLRARLGLPVSGAGSTAITPAEVVPPGEIGHASVGKVAGPDDPNPVVIEGTVKRPKPPSRPQSWDDTEHGRRWRAWVDAGSPGGGDRWSNRNGA
jgi:hypothetical protein